MIDCSKNIQARRLLTLLLAIVTVPPLFAQNNRKQRIYEAYILGNRTQWVQVVNEMVHSNEPKTLSWKLELAEYYYGMAGYSLSIKNKDLTEAIITKGNTLIDGILKEQPDHATAMALKGSMTAFQISLNRLKALTLSKEALKWLDKALKTDPNNVQALVDRGNAYVHAPVFFGGNPELGIQLYLRGLALLEKRNLVTGNWFYLHLLVTTANAYKKTGLPEKAKLYYERALEVEPRFRLVSDTLLPALKQKV